MTNEKIYVKSVDLVNQKVVLTKNDGYDLELDMEGSVTEEVDGDLLIKLKDGSWIRTQRTQ